MPLCNLSEFRSVLPKGARILGLDLGETVIGMAVSDPGLKVASPIGAIKRSKFTKDVEELARAMRDRSALGLIIGMPINMDGSHGPRCQATRDFADNLLGKAALFGSEPCIGFWDERLSTRAVDHMMVGWDMTRKRRSETVDKLAACYILQGALDFLGRTTPGEDMPGEVAPHPNLN
jgi:putative holliday junction resolvase